MTLGEWSLPLGLADVWPIVSQQFPSRGWATIADWMTPGNSQRVVDGVWLKGRPWCDGAFSCSSSYDGGASIPLWGRPLCYTRYTPDAG